MSSVEATDDWVFVASTLFDRPDTCARTRAGAVVHWVDRQQGSVGSVSLPGVSWVGIASRSLFVVTSDPLFPPHSTFLVSPGTVPALEVAESPGFAQSLVASTSTVFAIAGNTISAFEPGSQISVAVPDGRDFAVGFGSVWVTVGGGIMELDPSSLTTVRSASGCTDGPIVAAPDRLVATCSSGGLVLLSPSDLSQIGVIPLAGEATYLGGSVGSRYGFASFADDTSRVIDFEGMAVSSQVLSGSVSREPESVSPTAAIVGIGELAGRVMFPEGPFHSLGYPSRSVAVTPDGWVVLARPDGDFLRLDFQNYSGEERPPIEPIYLPPPEEFFYLE